MKNPKNPKNVSTNHHLTVNLGKLLQNRETMKLKKLCKHLQISIFVEIKLIDFYWPKIQCLQFCFQWLKLLNRVKQNTEKIELIVTNLRKTVKIRRKQLRIAGVFDGNSSGLQVFSSENSNCSLRENKDSRYRIMKSLGFWFGFSKIFWVFFFFWAKDLWWFLISL